MYCDKHFPIKPSNFKMNTLIIDAFFIFLFLKFVNKFVSFLNEKCLVILRPHYVKNYAFQFLISNTTSSLTKVSIS